ncbi:EngB-like GTP-binding protein [Skeletonema marinoi]|uniref:EngB-like GTP-binding protein n=1 Tax=Skeletonema marinoi TaxID=267567 RepID=A0AAD9D550_9STRA|nr:EngB-like GTP-binding protein [Skeletonema marinoi]
MIRHSHQQLILCCRLSRGGGISSSASSCRQAAASASCTSQHYHLTAPHHDFRQHRYMQTDTATAATISNRLDFKSTPIIPSILSHIERIGVGIRPKPSRKKRRTPSLSKGGHGDNSAHTLDEVEEREYFKQGRMTSRHTNSNSQRGNVIKTDAKHGNKWQNKNNKHRDGKKQDKPDDSTSSSTNVGTHWLPPPPFSTYTKGTSATTTSRQRRPVKILGSAASLNDELPRESKGLSEVALAGRSNVGKSTLLNALLYGNIDVNLTPRKYQRGRTPEGAKLPRGVKAVTSDKPGETKRMSFYQLTADVAVGGALSGSENNEGEVKEQVKVADDDKAATDGEAANEIDRHLKYSLVLVDLPGFGFAFAKEGASEEWNDLMNHYLLERRTLKRILLLLDARHGFKLADFEFLEALQEGLKQQNSISSSEEDNTEGGGRRRKKKRRELPPIQIVLTKCDLVKQVDLARRVVVVRQQLSDALAREPSSLPVMLVSARAGLGFNNIRGAEQLPMGGVLELQKELASLVPMSKVDRKK